MAGSTSHKFTVTTFKGETYEVTADRAQVDGGNTNRVTFYKGSGDNETVVAQENETASFRPS